jgi:peptidoglycan/LPS O-acetylase OafA/YrhL
MTATKEKEGKPRYFGLDILRAVAIVFVLITHAAVFFPDPNFITYGLLPGLGFVGVEIFFGLSGFLIGSILLERKYSLGVFYLKRLMKILPPYLLILLLIFIFSGFDNISVFASHLFFLQNFYPSMSGYFPVSWSLAIEFWFYLLIPVLLLNRIAQKNIGRQLLILSLGVLGLLAVIRFVYVEVYNPAWEFGIHRFVPLRFDTMIFGVVAALIVRQHKRLYEFLTQPIVAILNTLGMIIIIYLFGSHYYNGVIDSVGLFHSIGLTARGANIMILILCVQKYIHYPMRAWAATPAKVITFISYTSYSLYLVHLFVYLWIAHMLGGGWLPYILAVILSVVGAWLFYETVEKQALRAASWLQKKYFERPRTAPAIETEVVRQP